jgi:hypothetical protein
VQSAAGRLVDDAIKIESAVFSSSHFFLLSASSIEAAVRIPLQIFASL